MDDVKETPDSEEEKTIENPEEASEPSPPPGKKRRLLRYAFVLTMAIFLAIPYYYTSNPESCTMCHDMKKYYDSWKESSHSVAAKNCFDCHVKQGSINLWVYRISFYREIYASVVGAKLKPAGATVPGIESCQRKGCHSLNRIKGGSGDIKINHRLHILKTDIPCIQCHPGAAHPNVEGIGSLIPHRKLCFECHASRKNDCSFCHNKRFSAVTQYSH